MYIKESIYGKLFKSYLFLELMFILVRITKVISWSWWIVLAPLYIPAILVIIGGMVIVWCIMKRVNI